MRTPKYVPKQAIEWIVARFHVGTPDAEVAADIRRRLERKINDSCFEKNANRGRRMQAYIAYALDCHHKNGALYTAVQTGKF